jgi:hypothetical protein
MSFYQRMYGGNKTCRTLYSLRARFDEFRMSVIVLCDMIALYCIHSFGFRATTLVLSEQPFMEPLFSTFSFHNLTNVTVYE